MSSSWSAHSDWRRPGRATRHRYGRRTASRYSDLGVPASLLACWKNMPRSASEDGAWDLTVTARLVKCQVVDVRRLGRLAVVWSERFPATRRSTNAAPRPDRNRNARRDEVATQSNAAVSVRDNALLVHSLRPRTRPAGPIHLIGAAGLLDADIAIITSIRTYVQISVCCMAAHHSDVPV